MQHAGEPAADEGADDADHDVAEQAEAAALDQDPASQPATAPITIQAMMLWESIISTLRLSFG